MKKTILCSALIALASIQAYADEPALTAPPTPEPAVAAPATAPTAAEPAAATPASAPATAEPVAATPAPAPALVINCDYKIPPETKKIEQSIVLTWSERAVNQAFSFDPSMLDAQMQKLQPCFTEQGWTGFNAALQKSGNIEAIKSQKLVVTSQVDGQTLVNEVKENEWKLIVPIAVTYQNEKEKVSQLLSVDVTVSRKPSGDLGITQMIAAPRGTVNVKTPPPQPANPANTSLDTKPQDSNNQPPLGKPQ